MKSDIKRLVKRSTAGFLAVWMVFGNSISAFSNVEAGSGRAGQKKEETVSTALEMEKKKTPKMMTSSNAEKKNVLSAEVGSMEIQIREKTAGALEQAEALEVYDLGQDATVEAALLEKLEEGEELAGYVALDISLFDGEGAEIEPDGNVNVEVSGIEAPGEYDDVMIVHLEEREHPGKMRPMGVNRPNLPMTAAHNEEEGVYDATVVTEGIKDEIEKSDRITFTAESFSSYVITFIKSATEYQAVDVFLMDTRTGDEFTAAADNLQITVDDDGIEILKLVEGNQMGQIAKAGEVSPDGEAVYMSYAYASTDEEGNERITHVNFAEIEGKDQAALYLWYDHLGTLEIPVEVYLEGSPADEQYEFTIVAGTIRNNAEAVLNEAGLTEENGNYAFEKAVVYRVEDGEEQEIEIVSRIGDTIYYSTKVSNGVVGSFKEGSGRTIRLYYKEAYKVTLTVTAASGTETNIGNTVNGQYVGDTIEIDVAKNGSFSIPITIAQGYAVKVECTEDPALDYNSADAPNHLREYTINGTNLTEDIGINITFSKPALAFTYDFSNESIFHNTTVEISQGGSWQEAGKTGTISVPEGDDSLSIRLNPNSDFLGSAWIFDALAVNDQALMIPVDPGFLSGSWNSEENSELFDTAGKKIADVTITVDRGFLSRNRIYTIAFSNIKCPLKMTGGSMREYFDQQAILYEKGDGLQVSWAYNDGGVDSAASIEKGDAIEFNQNVTYYIDPDWGWYIDQVVVSPQNENGDPVNLTDQLAPIDVDGKWYDRKKVTMEFAGWADTDAETLVRITSKEINYQFVWNNGGAQVPLSDSFTLPGDDSFSQPLYSNVIPDETATPEGKVFQGWTLGTGDTHIHWGNESVSRTELLEAMKAGTLTMEYPPTASENVKILLTPQYVEAAQAETIPYSVEIYLGSESGMKVGTFEYRGIAGTAIEEGAYIERPEIKTVIDQNKDEYPEKEIIGIESLSNTDNVVKIILKKEYVQIHTVVEAEGNVSHGNYQYGSDIFENEDLMVRSGDTIRLKIVPDEGYTIGQLFIGGTPQTIDRSKIDEDGNYEIEYTVSETATIWTSFAVDVNGNGEPDETETTYSITYAAGTAGTNAQNMPQNETDILSGTTKTLPTTEPTWTGHVFAGWTSDEVQATTGNFIMPEANVTFTAAWKVDANGDGEPDDTEAKYSITYSDGEAKGAAQGMPAKAENILSGTTQTISAAVPTWIGYVFTGWTSTDVTETTGNFTMPEKDVTFTATWKVDANGDGEPDDTEAKYSITYSDGEAKGAAQGMPAKAENILSGTTQTISAAVPTWTGHVFTGWTSTDVTETAGNFTMPEKDVTFTATWKVDANGDGEPDENEQKYSISYSDGEANGNAEKMPQNETDILSGTTKTLPTTEPTWTGHVFAGWTSDEVQATTGNFIMPEANVTFTATWKVDANGDGEPDDTETKYSITYSDGEAKGAAQGMPAKAENILSGTTQTISAAVPTWTGYVFTGWTSTDVTETAGSFTMPEENVTFTATWKEDANGDGEPDDTETKYSITYSDGEAKGAAQGMPAKAENILSGTTQTISTAVPTWTGYVFAGWTSNEVQATSGSFIMPEANVTFTATWKEDANGDGEPDDAETKYSITYSDGEANGNAQNMPQNETDILSGTTQTLLTTEPTWVGHVFDGWTTSDVTVSNGSFTMPEANVTFTATWKVDANGDGEPDDTETKYSITYSDGEAKGAAQGMPAKAENILSGTTQTISAAIPTWAGHVFAGWTSTDVTETTGSFTMPEKDVTFTALWKEYSSGGSKEDDDDDDASEENGGGNSRKPIEAQKGQVVNAAGKTGEWVLEGNQFTEQNGYIPSREYLKIDGNIYGFYSRGYAIGSEHGHYYTSEAIAAAGGYRDAQGAWNLNGWWIRYSDGTYPHGQWEYLTYNGRSDWYYFDEDGWMEDGWFQWEDHWYYLHTEYDGFRGHMYTGWHEIGGKWYYFRTDQDGGTPGAMMTDARTPDGFYVGEDGAWIQ